MSNFFSGIAWLIPFFPLLAPGVAVLGPKRMRTDAPHSGGRRHRAGVSGLAGFAIRGRARENDVRDELADDQQLRDTHRVSHRRADHDDAVDGDVRLVARGRLRGPATWRATRAIAGFSP